jgi:hypothetical protein
MKDVKMANNNVQLTNEAVKRIKVKKRALIRATSIELEGDSKERVFVFI